MPKKKCTQARLMMVSTKCLEMTSLIYMYKNRFAIKWSTMVDMS